MKTKQKTTLPGLPTGVENIINTKAPEIPGKYIVYFMPVVNTAWSNTKTECGVDLAYWNGIQWLYHVPILAYCGPINILSSEELEKGNIVCQIFYTGTKEQISNGECQSGPHNHYFKAFCEKPIENSFIWCFDTKNKSIYPISKCKQIEGKLIWKKLGDITIEKYKRTTRVR
jgi:hypothetical protein